MRAIDADALIECLQTWKTVSVSEGLPINERFATAMIAQVNLMPTIEERKTGKWIGYNTEQDGWKRTDGSPVFMSCSECNGLVFNNGSARWNFCPNCGSYNGDESDDIPIEYFENGGI